MIVSTPTRSFELAAPAQTAPSARGRALREWAIDALCFVLSVGAAGVLSLALMAAAELPSVTASPVSAPAQATPGAHG